MKQQQQEAALAPRMCGEFARLMAIGMTEFDAVTVERVAREVEEMSREGGHPRLVFLDDDFIIYDLRSSKESPLMSLLAAFKRRTRHDGGLPPEQIEALFEEIEYVAEHVSDVISQNEIAAFRAFFDKLDELDEAESAPKAA